MRPELLALFAVIAFSTSAGAQPGDGPRACPRGSAPLDRDYDRESAAEWPQEARRLKSNEQSVSRRGDRLRLALDGGGTVELVDCPYGDTAYRYLYERYDEAGRFYVIRTPAHEDFSYTLVMRRTGQMFTVHGAPVWAGDKSRFLTVACSLLPPRGSLVIQVPSDDALVTEAEITLPCETESCSARWDFQSWISVACAPRDSGGRGTEFVVMRGNDGDWKRFGR